MKYKIFEIETDPRLTDFETGMYGKTYQIKKSVLKELECRDVFESHEEAIKYINEDKEYFKGRQMTILPIIEI